MLINLNQAKISISDSEFHSGDKIKVEIEVIIDEPTLTGYNGMVSATKYNGLSIS